MRMRVVSLDNCGQVYEMEVASVSHIFAYSERYLFLKTLL